MDRRTIAHYEILEEIGAGGMGEVYAARDNKLNRKVALKVLPSEVADDPERRERFEREAKAVAALNHPNIVTIHSIEEVDDVSYLTMELVEGEQLVDIIPEGGLNLERFFELAIPLADALSAAHAQGIVHRDLKPGNIMVTDEGRLKVLDFGLAKLRQEVAPDEATQLTTEGLTEEGRVLGTFPYMSPEQVQGKRLDHRSDIFSLGIILYQMATGERPFKGATSAHLISSILRDTPSPVIHLKPDFPRHVGRIIQHCLQKEPSRRYQSARDVYNELTELKREVETESAEEQPRVPPPRRLAGLRAVAAVVVGGVLLVWLLVRLGRQETTEPTTPATASQVTRVTFSRGLERDPTWSPDGRFLAYSIEKEGNLDIMALSLGGEQPIPVVDHPADDAQPAWSPDGERIAFVSARDQGGRLGPATGFGILSQLMLTTGGDLYLAPAFGGAAVKLARDAYYPTWSPDGNWIAFQASGVGQWDIWKVASTGGRPERLTDDVHDDHQPAWSPDGRWIAFASLASRIFPKAPGGWSLRVLSADGTKSTTLRLERAWILQPAWSPEGRFVYFSSNKGGTVNVWRTPFSPCGPELEEPQPFTVGSGSDVDVSVSPATGALAFSTLRQEANIWELDVDSRETRQITFETTLEDTPDLSPDGESLVVVSDRSGSFAVWTFDRAGTARIRLGPVSGPVGGARWSPDGSEVVYNRFFEDGHFELVRQRPGSLEVERLGLSGSSVRWSRDGRRLAFTRADKLYSYNLRDGSFERLAPETEAIETSPTWSPDGEWIVYNIERRLGDRDLARIPAGGGEPEPLLVGPAEDSHPDWSPVDANLLLFLRDHKNIFLLNLATGEERQLTSYESAYITLDYPAWSPDGTRIYYSVTEKTGDIFITGK